MACLFVIQGRDQGQRFELDAAVLGLGRDPKNAIHLHDFEVSRRHAQVVVADGNFKLVDLDSSNGSFVNSQRVDQHVLRSGDRVQVGRTLMIFTGDEDKLVGRSGRRKWHRGPRAPAWKAPASSPRSARKRAAASSPTTDSSASPWLARARSNLQVMYRTALAVSHTLDIDQLLQRIMELIFEWVEADRGCIMLVDRETGELTPKVFRHRQERRGEQTERCRSARRSWTTSWQHQEGVLTSDAREDERWDTAASIVKMGVREAICVPMQGRYGVVGVIYIDTYTPPGRACRTATATGSPRNI